MESCYLTVLQPPLGPCAAPVHGSAHAAFFGSSWDGQRIACVVTGVVDGSAAMQAAGGGEGGAPALPPASTLPARLQFHFRSVSAQVVSHVQVGCLFQGAAAAFSERKVGKVGLHLSAPLANPAVSVQTDCILPLFCQRAGA